MMAWYEQKTINGHDYYYLRWRDYLPDGVVVRRSVYIGKDEPTEPPAEPEPEPEPEPEAADE